MLECKIYSTFTIILFLAPQLPHKRRNLLLNNSYRYRQRSNERRSPVEYDGVAEEAGLSEQNEGQKERVLQRYGRTRTNFRIILHWIFTKNPP